MRRLIFVLAAGVLLTACHTAKDEVVSRVGMESVTESVDVKGVYRDTLADSLTVCIEDPVMMISSSSGDSVLLTARKLTLTRGRHAAGTAVVERHDTVSLVKTDTVYVARHEQSSSGVGGVSSQWLILCIAVMGLILSAAVCFKFKTFKS